MKAESKHTRFFSAIMVVDIVGFYTINQRKEKKAERYRELFWEAINKQVPDHRGRIIQSYTDAAVNLFKNVPEAVCCALKIRKQLKKESVPTRIGIHQGVISQKAGNIYGNTVHFASMIKSMCRAGDILISDNINWEIRNNRNIHSTKVGCFAFNNGQNTMDIYSIVQDYSAIQINNIYARWSKVESMRVRTDLVQPYLTSHHPELLN